MASQSDYALSKRSGISDRAATDYARRNYQSVERCRYLLTYGATTLEVFSKGSATKIINAALWFVPDPDFASLTEWYLELFNDNFFDEFIESGDVGLSTELRTACKGFSRLFKEYFDGLPDHPDPAAIIDDPGWRRIRDEARVLLDGLP